MYRFLNHMSIDFRKEGKLNYQKYEIARDEKGLKNSQVAKLSGVSPVTLSDWKRDKSKPKADKLLQIAKVLDKPLEYFIE